MMAGLDVTTVVDRALDQQVELLREAEARPSALSKS
jgi:hypothetical protein